MTTAQGGG